MFVELHMIQNFAPSNLNRDDTGSPKDAEFGGFRRARISSQAIKRPIRRHPTFAKTTGVSPSERTKWLTRRLTDALIGADKSETDAAAVALGLTKFYAGKKGKMDNKNGRKTNVLLFLSTSEIAMLRDAALENWDGLVAEQTAEKPKDTLVKQIINKRLIPRVKERTSAPDIALFGRMLADQPDLEIDAACQVAHAISTHRITMEMDYFTAVDRLVELGEAEEDSGAGMVGYTTFNSACFYRYARIDVGQLQKSLEDDTLAQRTVEGFLRAALEAIPTGKQNAFAAQNPTSLAVAVVRKDGKCWNLVNAFEQPITAKNSAGEPTGYVAPSIRAFDAEWEAVKSFYDDAQIEAVSVHVAPKHRHALNALAEYVQPTFSAWIETVMAKLTEA